MSNSVKIRKSDLHKVSDRVSWFPIILKNQTKPTSCAFSPNELEDKKVSGNNLILTFRKDFFEKEIAGNYIPNGEIECKISLYRPVDVGDFSKDFMYIGMIQGFWKDEIGKSNVERYDEKSKTIYLKEGFNLRKVLEAFTNEQ